MRPWSCRVLAPYLKGGGAKSLDFQSLSQDLIRTSMQIPFSVPPYMSLLARSTATLEGIALMGDPNYQMVSQVRSQHSTQFNWCFCWRVLNYNALLSFCNKPSHPDGGCLHSVILFSNTLYICMHVLIHVGPSEVYSVDPIW